MRVVVVHAAEGVRDTLGAALQARSCDVTIVSEASDVLAALDARPDVILAEYASRDAFRALRARVPSDAQLIALIDVATASAIRAALEDGADDYMFTGLDPAVIDGCAHRIARLSGLRGELEALTRVERALRESERDYRELFEGAHDAILIIRPDDEVVLAVNQRACEAYRLPRDRFVGRSLIELSLDPDRGRGHIGRTLRRGSFYRFETTQRRGDGTVMDLEVSATMVEYGGERAILSINRDVTDIRLARERLARQDAELRTAHRMESLGRLAAGVAHDFNNLLTAISACTQHMRRVRPDAFPEELEDIETATDNGTKLVRELMHFAKRGESRTTLVNVNEVVIGMGPVLQRLAGKRIDVDLQLDDRLGPISMDRAQLERALLNLVINARDAIDGRGRVIVSTEARAATAEGPAPATMPRGQLVMLRVSDSGRGMDAETSERVFDPFFTTKGTGGTGLGLSTVYGIVSQAGGHIDLETAVGAGTTFKLLFPVAELDDAALMVSDRPSARTTGVVQRCTVLEPHRFRKLMDGVDDAIYVADAETGRFVDVNAAACEMLGYTRDELLRMTPTDLKTEAMKGAPDRWASQVALLRASGSFTITTIHQRRDGGTTPVEIRVTLRESGGREYVVGICRPRHGAESPADAAVDPAPPRPAEAS